MSGKNKAIGLIFGETGIVTGAYEAITNRQKDRDF